MEQRKDRRRKQPRETRPKTFSYWNTLFASRSINFQVLEPFRPCRTS
jgi:hypothetical protein